MSFQKEISNALSYITAHGYQIHPEAFKILKNLDSNIMEIFSYGLAISRSGMLIYDLFKKKSWKLLLKPTIIEIVIVVSILIVAAFIEWNLIKQIIEIPK